MIFLDSHGFYCELNNQKSKLDKNNQTQHTWLTCHGSSKWWPVMNRNIKTALGNLIFAERAPWQVTRGVDATKLRHFWRLRTSFSTSRLIEPQIIGGVAFTKALMYRRPFKFNKNENILTLSRKPHKECWQVFVYHCLYRDMEFIGAIVQDGLDWPL